jgi:hypothetical protein
LQDRALKLRQILRAERVQVNPAHYWDSDEEEEPQMWTGKVKIRRNYEFIDAFDQLKKRDIRQGFTVTFINQLGLE